MDRQRHPRARNRGLYMALIVLVICCGLGVRSDLLAVPPFLAKYAGDALWALMIFLGIGVLLPWQRTGMIAVLTAAVCVIVECSQLYHAPWLDSIRSTWLGRMALGNAFGWGDLAAYLAGILTGGLTEWIFSRARSTKSQDSS